jgi:exosome complex RNA-binding protein Csl4
MSKEKNIEEQNPIEELQDKVAETPDGGKVLIDKLTLDNILERLANVEQSAPIRRVTKIGNSTARVRLVGESKAIVKGYGKTWEKIEAGGKKVLMIEVFDVDGNKHEVNCLDFMNTGEYVEAEILSIDKEEIEDTLGMINPTRVDYDNYRTEVLDKEVPLKVTSVEHVYKMRLPDGKEVSLPAEALN